MAMQRRAFLASLMTVPVAGCVKTRINQSGRKPLGLVELTVAQELKRGYFDTLRRVAGMGYTHFGFRLASYDPNDTSELAPAVKAEMVRDAGLEVGVVRYGQGRSFAEQAEAAAMIGAKMIAFSAAPVFYRGSQLGVTTRTAFDAWLPELGIMAAIARSNGIDLLYHNHWWDHRPLDGETPLHLVARSYSPEEIKFEIDIAWAALGGADPVSLVESLGPRVAAMHFKDVDSARGADYKRQLVAPGSGRLKYSALIPLLDAATDAIGYVEVDEPEDGLVDAASAALVIRTARGEIPE